MNSLSSFVFHCLDLMHVLDFIMPLHKAWDVLRRKRKSVIADSFDEFVVKGELNSISSDFVVFAPAGISPRGEIPRRHPSSSRVY